jgi:ribosome-associated protein
VVDLVETSLDDDKAEDITVIALAGKSSIAEYMIIASGRNSRQLGAMADHLSEKLKALGFSVAVEGKAAGDWVLLDAGDVVVHLFRPEVRAFYNLEKMWGVAQPARAMAPAAESFAPTPV